MDKNKFLKPIFVVLLSIFVVMLSIRFVNVNNDEKMSELDKVIAKYENRLLSQESYLNISEYMNIEIEEEETYAIVKFSSKGEDLEDIIIIISNNDLCLSYGVKDSVGSDFVIDDFDADNNRIKGVKIIFDLSESYYIYVSYIVNDVVVEEYIKIN